MRLSNQYRVIGVEATSSGPREVSTGDINQQVFQTFQHLIPGDWKVYREQKPYEYIKIGSILLLGQGVKRGGDQYLVSVKWTLYDEDMNMAGIYKEAPTHYSPVRGSARVSLNFTVQGYRPGDKGALGGMINVSGLPMTPIWFDGVGISDVVDTPYQVVQGVEEVISYYDGGYFKEVPGGVKLSKDYYKTEYPEEGYPDSGYDIGSTGKWEEGDPEGWKGEDDSDEKWLS